MGRPMLLRWLEARLELIVSVSRLSMVELGPRTPGGVVLIGIANLDGLDRLVHLGHVHVGVVVGAWHRYCRPGEGLAAVLTRVQLNSVGLSIVELELELALVQNAARSSQPPPNLASIHVLLSLRFVFLQFCTSYLV